MTGHRDLRDKDVPQLEGEIEQLSAGCAAIPRWRSDPG